MKFYVRNALKFTENFRTVRLYSYKLDRSNAHNVSQHCELCQAVFV
jgi:hypothetical protein